jgi:hypothetical protein
MIKDVLAESIKADEWCWRLNALLGDEEAQAVITEAERKATYLDDAFTAALATVQWAANDEPVNGYGCAVCVGRWDPVRDWHEYIHEPRCPWLLATTEARV